MPAEPEKLVKQLVDLEILAPNAVQQLAGSTDASISASDLVNDLVKQKQLTRFQGQQVLAGKARALILGNYTILDRVGAGGMGQVFKALHRRMKRTVAIKTLPREVTKDAAAAARFQREVEAAARLSHPNIVAAHDADEAHGSHFLVMEYVEGADLAATVKKSGPLAPDLAARYILQAARGLEYAHAQGVVHRDIKPANLLVDAQGMVKVLDMGLARLEQQSDVAAQAELTNAGTVMGTVDYMSPEQAMDSRQADARSDIYSLGCTLYYLLAGQPPFQGDTIMKRMAAHQQSAPPQLPAAPAELNRIFQKMVAKRPSARFQTMREVVAALESCESIKPSGSSAIKNSLPPATTPPPAPSVQLPVAVPFAAPIAAMPVAAQTFAGLGSNSNTNLKRGKAESNDSDSLLAPVVKKTWGLTVKLVGGAFGTIIAPLLVAYIWKYLDTASTPAPPPTQQAAAVGPQGPGSSPAEKAPPTGNRTIPVVTAPSDRGSPAATQSNIHRRAAEWVLQSGGKINVLFPDGKSKDVAAGSQLPPQPFRLRSVDLNFHDDVDDHAIAILQTATALEILRLERTKVGNAGITLLHNLTSLEKLSLANTRIDDQGLAELKAFSKLTFLDLGMNRITDRGLDDLRGLDQLATLELDKTQVTDAGIKSLQNLTSLTSLNLKSTGVTAQGISRLQSALPGCKIEWDAAGVTGVLPSKAQVSTTTAAAPKAVVATTEPADRLPTASSHQLWPVPDAASVAKGDALVKDVFKGDLEGAKTPKAKVDLGAKLLTRADESSDDPAAVYALLCQARDLGIAAFDPVLADRAIRALAMRFDVDRTAESCRALEKMSASSGPAASMAISESAYLLAKEFADGEQWDAVNRLASVAVAAARHASSPALVRQAVERQKRFVADKQLWEAAESARAVLEKSPEDPDANLALGRYLCFVRGDWDHGLAPLALSNSDVLKDLAAKSKAVPADPTAQAVLGDTWWDAAEKAKGRDQDELKKGAGYWYGLALNGLTSLAKTRVEKRLAELAGDEKSAARPAQANSIANGLSIPQVLDCSMQPYAFKVGPSFDPSKSWTLMLEFTSPAFDRKEHQILAFGDGTQRTPIFVQIDAAKLEARVMDVSTNRAHPIFTPLAGDDVGKWIPVVLRYDAATNEFAAYVKGNLTKREKARVELRSERPVGVRIGVGSKPKEQRFLGGVRATWLGNQQAFTPPATTQ